MNFVLKWVIYLLILALLGLVAYTYLGPYFGADFSPPQSEVRMPVTLDAE